MQEANFAPDRLLTLRTRLSAAYKGVHALLMRRGALDFRSGQPFEHTSYFDESVDIHHIFPKAWCQSARTAIDRGQMDCIVNKTPVTSRTTHHRRRGTLQVPAPGGEGCRDQRRRHGQAHCPHARNQRSVRRTGGGRGGHGLSIAHADTISSCPGGQSKR